MGRPGRSGASILAGNLRLRKTRDAAEEEALVAMRARYGSMQGLIQGKVKPLAVTGRERLAPIIRGC